MANKLEIEGDFQGRILNVGMYESDKGSVGINFDLEVIRSWDTKSESWIEWHPDHKGYQVKGTAWIVTQKDGVSKRTVESICSAIGWDGDFETLERTDFAINKMIQFTVKAEEYNGEKQYKASFFKPCGSTVGGKISESGLQGLRDRFGKDIRNIAKDAQPSAPVQVYTEPAAAPAVAPAPAPQAVAQPAPFPPAQEVKDDMPF